MAINRPITHPNPKVSVVIPTLPGNEIHGLEPLSNQTIDAFEVLVVEDDELDICEARNHGLEEANAPIVAHTDDDCRPPPDWIETIHTLFDKNPDLVLVEGGTDVHNPGPRHYVGANIAYRAEEALKIGGFDSTFAGWRDDTEFGWRIEEVYGADATVYVPELKVEHIGPMRTLANRENERLLRHHYPAQYFEVFVNPQNRRARVFTRTAPFLYAISTRMGETFSHLTKILPGEQ